MNRELFQTVLADKRDDRPKCLKDIVRRPKSFHYYKLFVRLARAMNPDLIIELGTAQGVGALHFRQGTKTAKIITVDIVRSLLTKDRLLVHDIKGIICDAVEYADWVGDGSVDILFIDTNMNKENEPGAYKLLTDELDAWLPKMKPGGIVLFDDIRNGDMFKAWEELEGDKQEVRALHPALSFGVLFL
jgi:predicted O-methyltransferase YrrM